jgi:DNA-binding transcriptional ArsR family regulator
MGNTKEELLLNELAELSKALSHPHRIRIIKILAGLQEDGRCQQCMVGNIVDQLPIAQSTVSQHLKVLKDSGWIEGRIDGPRVCYCLRENIFKYYKSLIDNIR